MVIRKLEISGVTFQVDQAGPKLFPRDFLVHKIQIFNLTQH